MISVILPSHNGADTLPETLAALAALAEPPGGHEIVLVDSGSDDRTTQVLLREFAERHPAASLLIEPLVGKSRALNRAIEAATGELLVFVDDDIVVPPRWLLEYAAGAARHPDAGVFARAIAPLWRQPPPAWLAALAAEGRSCGATPAGIAETTCGPSLLKGGNFAVRRAALGELRFSGGAADFGAAQGHGGEDTDLAFRLVQGGTQLVFLPLAGAEHIVQPGEATAAAVFARYRRIGAGRPVRRPKPLAAFTDSFAAAALAAGAASAWLIGRRVAAARHMTRLASRLGRLERLIRG